MAINIRNLEKRVAQLEARNKRVETDKAWEVSLTRRLAIMALTYLLVVGFLQFIAHTDPWIDAFLAVAGFFVSTLTISILKKFWIAQRK